MVSRTAWTDPEPADWLTKRVLADSFQQLADTASTGEGRHIGQTRRHCSGETDEVRLYILSARRLAYSIVKRHERYRHAKQGCSGPSSAPDYRHSMHQPIVPT